jgi:LuxR family maltose regulon positive regulatory protein
MAELLLAFRNRSAREHGWPTVNRDYLARLLTAFPDMTSPVTTGLTEGLSERELEILRLISQGMTNKQIAAELFISTGTVKAHTANIYRKLDAENRTQAIALARELRLL